MDFAFYDNLSARSAGGAVLLPFRRALRFLLRPIFFRLRDILQELDAREREDRARVENLERVVAELQSQLLAHRPLVADYVAVTRRVAVLEDQLLKALGKPGEG